MLVKNASGTTLVTNAGSNGKFLAVLDLDVQRGGVKRYQYRLLPVFANLLDADKEMAALIRKYRAPFEAKLAEKLAVTEGLLYRRGNFNGTLRPGDPRRAHGSERRRDRVLARAFAGARACCPAKPSRWRT